SQLPGTRVVTTWDTRLGECPLKNCEVHVVESFVDETSLFRELSYRADFIWAIAPETGGVLGQRRVTFDATMIVLRLKQRPTFIGSEARAIAVCTDKLALSEMLRSHRIRTPKTLELKTVAAALPAANRLPTVELLVEPPLVLKPRDGAGSQDTFLIRT